MAIEFNVDTARRRVVLELSESFSMDDIVATIDRIIGHPDFESGFGLLSDHLALDAFLTPDQARDMVRYIEGRSAHFEGMRWAVVTRNPASYGMIRMLSVLLEGVPVRVSIFQVRADAEEWLASR